MADGVRLEIKRKMAAIELLFSKGFYFSFGLDLSKNYMDHKSQKEYIWNSGLMEEFLEFGFTDWNVPIIRGFWGELPLSNSQKYSLISRRVFPKVLGENLYQIGLNDEGECGDLIETEHLFINKTECTIVSYLQVCGTMGFYGSEFGVLEDEQFFSEKSDKNDKCYKKKGTWEHLYQSQGIAEKNGYSDENFQRD